MSSTVTESVAVVGKFESTRERSLSSSYDQVCRFFIQNKCLRGDVCPYSHDLSVRPDEDLVEASTCDVTECESASCCSICLQSVLVEGRRFGLLPRCSHTFCLECISAWRTASFSSKSVLSREGTRKCPVCRVASFFVIPSPRFFVGEMKKKRVLEYLKFLSAKPCRYYSESADAELCPYGPMCFFHHRNRGVGGIESAEDRKLRLVYTDGSCDAFSILRDN